MEAVGAILVGACDFCGERDELFARVGCDHDLCRACDSLPGCVGCDRDATEIRNEGADIVAVPNAARPLVMQLKALNLPLPELEHRFHPVRLWRFDLCWPAHMLAVEVDGAVWAAGRHNRARGYLADMEKLNEAMILGWLVLRVATDHVASGQAARWIREALPVAQVRADRGGALA